MKIVQRFVPIPFSNFPNVFSTRPRPREKEKKLVPPQVQPKFWQQRAGNVYWRRNCVFVRPLVCSDDAVRNVPFRKFCRFLAGSFSAVWKRNFARKYAFDRQLWLQFSSSTRFCILLHRCNLKFLAKKSVWRISNFCENSATILQVLQNLQNLILPNFKNFS